VSVMFTGDQGDSVVSYCYLLWGLLLRAGCGNGCSRCNQFVLMLSRTYRLHRILELCEFSRVIGIKVTFVVSHYRNGQVKMIGKRMLKFNISEIFKEN